MIRYPYFTENRVLRYLINKDQQKQICFCSCHPYIYIYFNESNRATCLREHGHDIFVDTSGNTAFFYRLGKSVFKKPKRLTKDKVQRFSSHPGKRVMSQSNLLRTRRYKQRISTQRAVVFKCSLRRITVHICHGNSVHSVLHRVLGIGSGIQDDYHSDSINFNRKVVI